MKRRRGFTLVELMIVVAIISILAAIAIPAFLRYIKSTRVAEADQMMQKIANGATAYFTSEQKYSDSATGDQPWHVGTTAQGQPNTNGMPIPFGLKTFPGGNGFAFNTTDGLTSFYNCGTAPEGGSKYVVTIAMGVLLRATLNKIKLSIHDPIYFQYGYIANGVGTNASLGIAAAADFTSGGNCHVIQQRVTVDAGSYEVVVNPRTTTNEFE